MFLGGSMMLEHWQLETYAKVHELTFPPPEWSTVAVERAAKPTIWAELTTMDHVVKGRPSVCPMPLPWALHWVSTRKVDVMLLPQFDFAFVGLGIFPKSQPCLVYSTKLLVDELLDECENYTLAVSLFESKLSKAYYGSGSPGFLTEFSY